MIKGKIPRKQPDDEYTYEWVKWALSQEDDKGTNTYNKYRALIIYDYLRQYDGIELPGTFTDTSRMIDFAEDERQLDKKQKAGQQLNQVSKKEEFKQGINEALQGVKEVPKLFSKGALSLTRYGLASVKNQMAPSALIKAIMLGSLAQPSLASKIVNRAFNATSNKPNNGTSGDTRMVESSGNFQLDLLQMEAQADSLYDSLKGPIAFWYHQNNKVAPRAPRVQSVVNQTEQVNQEIPSQQQVGSVHIDGVQQIPEVANKAPDLVNPIRKGPPVVTKKYVTAGRGGGIVVLQDNEVVKEPGFFDNLMTIGGVIKDIVSDKAVEIYNRLREEEKPVAAPDLVLSGPLNEGQQEIIDKINQDEELKYRLIKDGGYTNAEYDRKVQYRKDRDQQADNMVLGPEVSEGNKLFSTGGNDVSALYGATTKLVKYAGSLMTEGSVSGTILENTSKVMSEMAMESNDQQQYVDAALDKAIGAARHRMTPTTVSYLGQAGLDIQTKLIIGQAETMGALGDAVDFIAQPVVPSGFKNMTGDGAGIVGNSVRAYYYGSYMGPSYEIFSKATWAVSVALTGGGLALAGLMAKNFFSNLNMSRFQNGAAQLNIRNIFKMTGRSTAVENEVRQLENQGMSADRVRCVMAHHFLDMSNQEFLTEESKKKLKSKARGLYAGATEAVINETAQMYVDMQRRYEQNIQPQLEAALDRRMDEDFRNNPDQDHIDTATKYTIACYMANAGFTKEHLDYYNLHARPEDKIDPKFFEPAFNVGNNVAQQQNNNQFENFEEVNAVQVQPADNPRRLNNAFEEMKQQVNQIAGGQRAPLNLDAILGERRDPALDAIVNTEAQMQEIRRQNALNDSIQSIANGRGRGRGKGKKKKGTK